MTGPSDAAKNGSRSTAETPDYLIPRMGELPVSNTVQLVTAHLLAEHGQVEPPVLRQPLSITKESAAALLPAAGVLLTHEQSWVARGLALGNIQHSVSLAPGEVTQIAIVDWRRREQGQSDESTRQDDSTAESANQDRAVSEIQDATAEEVQRGASLAASLSVSAQGAYSSPFTSASVAANASTAVSTSYSDGSRDVAQSSNQRVNATTLRHAEATRARRATVVKETSQSENEELTTRVVANYNHAHSISMMYFEILEVFDLTTRVVDAERLIYLPMEVADVDTALVRRFSGALANAADNRGDADLAQAIRSWAVADRKAPPQPPPVKKPDSVDLRSEFLLDHPLGLTKMWNDAGDGLAQTVTFWAPNAREGWYTLGHYATSSNDIPDNSVLEMIQPVKDESVAAPVDFELVWNNKVAGVHTHASIWRPIPPPGYVALGLVTKLGESQPSRDSVRCVREDLVTDAKLGSRIWWSDKGEALDHFGCWPIKAQDDLGVNCGSFTGGPSESDANQARLPTKVPKRSASNPKTAPAEPIDETVTTTDSTSFICRRLNLDRLYYNQAIWLAVEPGALIEALRGVRWPSEATWSLAEVVNPHPVTVFGNYVGYRWHFHGSDERDDFLSMYLGEEDSSHHATVVVPTGGTFCEAVLGESIAAERIDITRFWKWQDSPIPILPPAIAALQAGGRASNVDTTTGQVGASAAALGQLSALPDPSGFGALSGMMQGQLFRDMSGSDVVKALALDASKHAADNADHAASTASQNFSSYLGFMKDMGQMAATYGGLDSTTLGGLHGRAAAGGLAPPGIAVPPPGIAVPPSSVVDPSIEAGGTPVPGHSGGAAGGSSADESRGAGDSQGPLGGERPGTPEPADGGTPEPTSAGITGAGEKVAEGSIPPQGSTGPVTRDLPSPSGGTGAVATDEEQFHLLKPDEQRAFLEFGDATADIQRRYASEGLSDTSRTRRVVRRVMVPKGTRLFKCTKGTITTDRPQLSPWWSTVGAFQENTTTALELYEMAQENKVPLPELVRMASAVSLSWNELTNYAEVVTTVDLPAFWGQFAPQQGFDPHTDQARITQGTAGGQDHYVTYDADSEKGVAGRKGYLPKTLGGLGAWQLYIPSFLLSQIDRTRIVNIRATNQDSTNNLELGEYLYAHPE